jgi:hypothetical protein
MRILDMLSSSVETMHWKFESVIISSDGNKILNFGTCNLVKVATTFVSQTCNQADTLVECNLVMYELV